MPSALLDPSAPAVRLRLVPLGAVDVGVGVVGVGFGVVGVGPGVVGEAVGVVGVQDPFYT